MIVRVSSVILVLAAVLVCLSGDTAMAEEPTVGSKSMEERPIKDKWALLIGINRFEDPSIPQLQYAAKDARDFAEFLIRKGNFARDHVLVLTNEQATDDNIKRALGDDWLPRRALPDDLVVIFVSTHGSPKEIDVAKDNFLIAYNTHRDSLFSSGLRLKDLAATVQSRTGCDRIVVLLDACNSGAAEAGGKGLYRAGNFDLSSLVGEGQIVISSSSADQRSWESKRYKNGVFTKSLMDSLTSYGEATTLPYAFLKLKDKVQAEVRFDRRADQIPLMKSKWKGKAVSLLARPHDPRPTQPYKVTSTVGKRRTGRKLASKSTQISNVHEVEVDKATEYYERGLRFVKLKDYVQAAHWYERAADLGSTEAQSQLGAMYLNGTGVDQDGSKALELLKKSSDSGDPDAQSLLGSLYLKGHVVTKDLGKALELITSAARQGNAKAQYFLGCMYATGMGVEKSVGQATHWLKKSAQGGVAKAGSVLKKLVPH